MKYFSKGIFYKEFKLAKWFFFILTGELLYLFNLSFIGKVQTLKEAVKRGNFNYENYSYTMDSMFKSMDPNMFLFIATVILFASIMVGNDFVNKKYELLAALPYKREEIIATKYIVTVIITVISFTISFFTVLITFKNNHTLLSYYLSYSSLFKFYFIYLLIYIFIITFTMFIQTICGKNILGGIFAGIFLVLPLGLAVLIDQVISIIFFSNMRFGNYDYIQGINEKISRFAYYLTPIAYGEDYLKYLNYGFKIIILIACIALLIYLLIISFKILPFERCGYVSIYRLGDVILKIGISFCTGLMAWAIMSANLISIFGLYEMNKYLVQQYVNYTIFYSSLCFIGVGILTYFITNKVIKLSKS